MNQIRNIIFDLGGVLMDIDFKRTFDAFEALGLTGAEQLFSRPDVERLFLELEIGRLEAKELRSRFRELSGLNSTDEEFDHAWNALLGDFPPERIRCVQQLSKTYHTYLLSNTNPIHRKHFNNQLNRHFGIGSLDHLLREAWYSHDLGLRKPDERIFRYVLESGRLNPDETLYADDAAINIKAAESVGMKGLLITPEFTIIDALKDL